MNPDLASMERTVAAMTVAVWNAVEEADPGSRFWVPLPVRPAQERLNRMMADVRASGKMEGIVEQVVDDFVKAAPQNWYEGLSYFKRCSDVYKIAEQGSRLQAELV